MVVGFTEQAVNVKSRRETLEEAPEGVHESRRKGAEAEEEDLKARLLNDV